MKSAGAAGTAVAANFSVASSSSTPATAVLLSSSSTSAPPATARRHVPWDKLPPDTVRQLQDLRQRMETRLAEVLPDNVQAQLDYLLNKRQQCKSDECCYLWVHVF
jgi:hypothetical protein